MVVLAISITTRLGKRRHHMKVLLTAVLSRQFKDMTKSRVEMLLRSFPQLVSQDSQHTMVETDAVRFVYQPLEQLYVVLMTTKGSNILQDNATLALVHRVTAEMFGDTPTEAKVLEYAFDLLSAYDEIVSMGYTENVTLSQVRTILEADSHEERIQDILNRNKEIEAKEELKRRAKQMEIQRREAQRGISSSSTQTVQTYRSTSQTIPLETKPESKPVFKGAGMKLGKKANTATMLGIEDRSVSPIAPVQSNSSVQRPTLTPLNAAQAIHLEQKETIVAALNREGHVQHITFHGQLVLALQEPQEDLRIAVLPGSLSVQFQKAPSLDKSAWAEQVLTKSNFNAGETALLKYTLRSKDETVLPIYLGLFTTTNAGRTEVSISCSLDWDHEVLDLEIQIPIPSDPDITSGQSQVQVQDETLHWRVGNLSNDEGATDAELAFSILGDDLDAVYPMQVSFAARASVCGVEIKDITQNNQTLPFSTNTTTLVDDFSLL